MKKTFLIGLISLSLLSACGSSSKNSDTDPVVNKTADICLAVVCVDQGWASTGGTTIILGTNTFTGTIDDCTGVHSYNNYVADCNNVDTSLADCPEEEPSKTVVDCSN